MLEEGWPVAVIDANEEALATAEDTLASDEAIFLKADVTDEEEIGAMRSTRWSTGLA